MNGRIKKKKQPTKTTKQNNKKNHLGSGSTLSSLLLTGILFGTKITHLNGQSFTSNMHIQPWWIARLFFFFFEYLAITSILKATLNYCYSRSSHAWIVGKNMQSKINMAQRFKVSLVNILNHSVNELKGSEVCEAQVKAWDKHSAILWTKTAKWKLNETKCLLKMNI